MSEGIIDVEIVQANVEVEVTFPPEVNVPTVGQPGPPGKAGTGWRFGQGAPTDNVGRDDDFYVDQQTWYAYGPKAGGTWDGAPSVNLRGVATLAEAAAELALQRSNAAGESAGLAIAARQQAQQAVVDAADHVAAALAAAGEAIGAASSASEFAGEAASAAGASVAAAGASQGFRDQAQAFAEQAEQAVSGGMLKSVYDADDDGKVDLAAEAETVPAAGVAGLADLLVVKADAASTYTKSEIDYELTLVNQAIVALGSDVVLTTYTASGTFTKQADDVAYYVEAWGAGGSGGYYGLNSGGVGGGGGEYVSRLLHASSVPSSVSITVPSGGSPRSTTGDGSSGGNASFGSLLTARGGSGGGNTSGGQSGSGANLNDTSPSQVFGGAAAKDSIYGGAGGGSSGNNPTSPGVSLFGGSGGARGVAGSAPGGGGGGGNGSIAGTPSGAGARGEVRVYRFKK